MSIDNEIEETIVAAAFVMIAGLAATDTKKRRLQIVSWLKETKQIIESDECNTFDVSVIEDAIAIARIQADMRMHPFFRSE